jgi:YidC/Oxa1 family membrane protein insertase
VATTPFADMSSPSKTSRRLSRRARWVSVGLFLALVAIAVVACGTARAADPTVGGQISAGGSAPVATASIAPDASPSHSPTPEPQPLVAAKPGADPLSLLAFLFTPLFQGLFILLAELYALSGNVVVAIILMTVLIRLLTLRLSARQIVSQKRMQVLAPELKELTKELQRRYKGDRQAVYAATQAFYKERGVSPTAGCLPSILQMGLLFPMYWVIRDGLTSYDPSAMLKPFGLNIVPSLTCPHVVNGVVDKAQPCINTVVAGINMGQPQVLFDLSIIGFTLGVSAMALASAFLQFVQSRMLMPPAVENDPSASSQRSMMVLFPFISILYGGFLPAGLFVYWITTSAFSIVQQFLIVGWGSMFPLFGWNPAFAQSHNPRFPVTMPEPVNAGKSLAATRYKPEERWASAASTVRPNTRKRAGRRGRRR